MASVPRSNPTARTASETIAEKIRAEIATSQLRPGDMLPSETTLLEQYDVARTTMREALRILESDGLVTVERGAKGGARIQEPSIRSLARRVGLHLQLRGATLRDLVDVQAAIQPSAAAQAAVARTASDVVRLRAAVARVAGSPSVDDFVAAVGELTSSVVLAAHNPVMALVAELISDVWLEGIRAFADQIDAPARYSAPFFAESAERYAALVDLIEAGDAAAAEAYWRDYLIETGVTRRVDQAPLHVYPTGGEGQLRR